jgi:hypothetical protein
MTHTARFATEKAVFRPALPLCFSPELTGEHMAKKPYAEQLKDPRWQKKRLDVLNDAGWCCSKCSSDSKTLHVHHKRYVKGREVWDYANDELEALCEECHAEHHETHALLEEVLAKADVWDPSAMALGLAAGYSTASGGISDDLARKAREKAGAAMFDLGFIAYALAVSRDSQTKETVQSLLSADGDGRFVRDAFDNWIRLFDNNKE